VGAGGGRSRSGKSGREKEQELLRGDFLLTSGFTALFFVPLHPIGLLLTRRNERQSDDQPKEWNRPDLTLTQLLRLDSLSRTWHPPAQHHEHHLCLNVSQ
jgi:hypothetical protein